KSGRTITSYRPFAFSFRGGATVALGDVAGDGRADLVVGSGPGMPAQVEVYAGATHKLFGTIRPFARSFRGGVTVAAGDVTGDRKAEIVVGSGSGMRATVDVFDASGQALLDSLSPFARTFRGGVTRSAAHGPGGPQARLVARS